MQPPLVFTSIYQMENMASVVETLSYFFETLFSESGFVSE